MLLISLMNNNKNMEKKKEDINFIAFIFLFFMQEKLFLSFFAYSLSLSFKNTKELFVFLVKMLLLMKCIDIKYYVVGSLIIMIDFNRFCRLR